MKFKTKSKQLKETIDKYWDEKDKAGRLKIDLEKANEKIEQQESRISEIEAEFENYKKQVNGERVCTKICEDCKNSYVHKEENLWNGTYMTYMQKNTVYKCKLDIHCDGFLPKEND